MKTLQEHLDTLSNPHNITVISANKNYFIFPQQSSELVYGYQGNDLDLTKFPNLEHLELSARNLTTPLTTLKLNNCSNLEKIIVSDNHLTSLDFLEQLPNPKKVKVISLDNNKFAKSDLTIFSKFTNLEELRINNNPFGTSLKPLRKLKKIKFLNIKATDIDQGLEYLPTKFVKLSQEKQPWGKNFASWVIHCSGTIEQAIEPYNYDLQAWWDANP